MITPKAGSTRKRGPGLYLVLAALVVGGVTAGLFIYGQVDPELVPDPILQSELGLGERDRVFTVQITGGGQESAEPGELTIHGDAFVEFVTTDWLVHEITFEVDSLNADARTFLERRDQVDSPPLLRRDSRFVVDFDEAPLGRYPYLLQGNGAPGRGVVVVVAKP